MSSSTFKSISTSAAHITKFDYQISKHPDKFPDILADTIDVIGDRFVNISNVLHALSKICHVNHFTDVHTSISGRKYDPRSTDRILLQGSDFVGHEMFQNNAYINGV